MSPNYPNMLDMTAADRTSEMSARVLVVVVVVVVDDGGVTCDDSGPQMIDPMEVVAVGRPCVSSCYMTEYGTETRDDVGAVVWTTFCCCISDSREEINTSPFVGAVTPKTNVVWATNDRSG